MVKQIVTILSIEKTIGGYMEIRHLITFQEVIHAGNFSKAAKNLGYTQSTVSTHIQMLETYFGEQLFNRAGKKVELTSFGVELSNKMGILLKEFESVKHLHQSQDVVEGVIRIGAPDSLMMYKLYQVIHLYKQQYPKVNIVITGGLCPDLREQVRKGSLDCCLMLQPLAEYEQLTVHQLKKEDFSLIFPKDHGNSLLPKPHQLVMLAEEGCTYRDIFLYYLKVHGYNPENIIETGSVEAIKKYVIDGLGVSYVPNYAIEHEIRDGVIIAKQFEASMTFYSQLIYHGKRWKSQALKRMVEMIIKHLSCN